MGNQVLGAKLLRKITADTGQDVVKGLGNGGWVMLFLTSDHRHGWWDKRTGEWGWEEDPMHWTSCTERFGPKDTWTEDKR